MPRLMKPPHLAELTPLQARWIQAVAANGGNGAAAAREAGYRAKDDHGFAVVAHQLRRNPKILNALRTELELILQTDAAFGRKQLRHLAEHGSPDSVRLTASQALLDRGGMQIVRKSEHNLTVEHQVPLDQLRARVAHLISELSPQERLAILNDQNVPESLKAAPQIVDAEFVEIPPGDVSGGSDDKD